MIMTGHLHLWPLNRHIDAYRINASVVKKVFKVERARLMVIIGWTIRL